MTIEEKQYLISSIKERKNVFDKLGIKLMDNADMQIAELMADFTPSVVPEFNPTGLITSQTKAFNKSFDYLEIFGTEITDKAKQFIVDNGYDQNFGARPLKRFIKNNVETLVARKIISGEVDVRQPFSMAKRTLL